MTASIPDERRRAGLSDEDQERSPDNVAPAVAFLASEGSDWCIGQVLRARGYAIGLYNVPTVIREVASAGPWDLQTAFEKIEQHFRPALTGTGRS